MKILNQYTLRSLKLNKTRTIVTVIGIILSVALFTAVTEGAYSGQQYIISMMKEQNGSFHAMYRDVSDQVLKQLSEDEDVGTVAQIDAVGYAEIGSKDTSMPYLYIGAASENLTQMLPIHLTQGRLPRTDTELLLPTHLYSRGEVKIAVGQTLRLIVGERELDGERLTQASGYAQGERLVNTTERTYTVVGFYERLDYMVEGYDAPGYLALTCGSGTGEYTAFFTLDDPLKTYDWLDMNAAGKDYEINSDLVLAYGGTNNNEIYQMLYGMMAILLALITFGSISLIYNSFSISVSERTKQFGLLKSIGATKRQLRHTVLFEAAVLCAVAIPLGLLVGCAGIGVTLYCLRDNFTSFLRLGEMSSHVQMQLVVGVWPLLLAAGIGLATALVSAWIPAHRAVRQSAITAIRQSQDIKIRSRHLRTSPVTGKLFGFSGVLASKNYKRNRKRYRATVVSLTLSVVLFISASTFSMYLKESVTGSYDLSGYDISYDSMGDWREDPEKLLQTLSAARSVTDGAYVYSTTHMVDTDPALLLESYRNDPYIATYLTEPNTGMQMLAAELCFVNDDEFLRLLSAEGLDAAAYFDETKPTALLYDNTKTRIYLDDGSIGLEYQTFDPQKLPATVDVLSEREIDGYWNGGYYYNEAGERFYSYYKTDGSGESLEYPAEEVTERAQLQIGAVLEQQPFFLSASCVTLILPYSMQRALLTQPPEADRFCFQADDHAAAYTDMLTILNTKQMPTAPLIDVAAEQEGTQAIITVMDVFAYGFIVLISLIAAANVFNTISTNVLLRRREFAMLRSVGMTQRGFRRMLNYECLMYGLKSLLYGLPLSFGVAWLIYRAVGGAFQTGFHLPWLHVAAAVVSVFLVVFATMVYSMSKIRRDNPIDALKEENL